MKERRRLLDEMRLSGREVKSSWQHYESMEFLANHLRLPSNGTDRGSSNNQPLLEDDDSAVLRSDISPTSVAMMSPASLADQHNNMKQEAMRSQNIPPQPWSTNGDTDRLPARLAEGVDSFPQSAAVPPIYPNFFNRPNAPAFAPHPLLAMWANGLHQANQQLTNQRPPLQTSTISNGSPNSEHSSSHDHEHDSSSRKRKKTNPNIDVTVSLKDMQPAEKYSEYHFCVSLAQMMEQVPASQRSELKIKLIQTVSSFLSEGRTASSEQPVSSP